MNEIGQMSNKLSFFMPISEAADIAIEFLQYFEVQPLWTDVKDYRKNVRMRKMDQFGTG
jgi:hypothetical protein